jgi:hypothetical protein
MATKQKPIWKLDMMSFIVNSVVSEPVVGWVGEVERAYPRTSLVRLVIFPPLLHPL